MKQSMVSAVVHLAETTKINGGGGAALQFFNTRKTNFFLSRIPCRFTIAKEVIWNDIDKERKAYIKMGS